MKHVLILTLNNSSPRGGSEKLWRRLADELVTRGYRVTQLQCIKHQEGHNENNLDKAVSIRSRHAKRHGIHSLPDCSTLR